MKCRVLSFSYLDYLTNVSMKPSHLSQPLLSYSDVETAQLVNGPIEAITKKGVVVTITDTIKGFVPLSQLSDVRVKEIEGRFHKGQMMACRVRCVSSVTCECECAVCCVLCVVCCVQVAGRGKVLSFPI